MNPTRSFLLFAFFAHPIYEKMIFALFILSFSRPRCSSDPGSLSRIILPPRHYATRFRFYRKNGAGRFSLVDTHRIAPTHAAFLYRLSAVVSFGFLFSNKLQSHTHVGFALQNQLY